MRVFVAGATGALGRPLVAALCAAGHDVVGLARSDANEAVLRAAGASAHRADPYDAAALARGMRGCDAVVRASTHIPASPRDRRGWAENDRVRREGTRALLDAAAQAGVPRYVQEGIVWVARPDDGARFDETAPPRPDGRTQSALDAERAAAAAAGLRAATLRLGVLYGTTSSQVVAFARDLRRRRLPVIGDGSAPLAFLHVDDAASAFVAAVERDAVGTFHVVDDRPTSTAEFFDAFAEALGAPRPPRVPPWLARLVAGGWTVRLLTTPMVTSNAAFRKATGWSPRWPSPVDGIRDVAKRLP